ncbi:GCN5 family acetyltransferase [Massilia sp. Root133]|uniref:GNAT family N-acetyltransferase n=1 Tax=Massilia cellulosiltytica TaxID=2683234 RepID=A0A7X3G1L8_9BURK|nr:MULTISPECIES: GNAT family protein [Telluria group]KQY16475.1 GCN5 family acetyltransferase [Massilia sp. Root133]KQZ51992.1 GCN5 family acetyltransferase [Massilia sp. Root1485]MVW61319.1 GNAT family N-acetyltransferase [Telluria cellulosilytica]
MIQVAPVTLEFNGVRLEPLGLHHLDGLRAAAADGELWNLRITSVPEPQDTEAYIRMGLETPNRVAFAVVDASSDTVIGTTSYHDIMPAIDRVEIGYTWYAKSRQRSHVNTSCKLLLLSHAFDTLGCAVVGLRTDNFNYASQAAIERLGAKKDGVLRHHAPRRDGTVRDTVMYSIVRGEWHEVKSHLHYRLARHAE